MKVTTALYAGSFDPPTKGHLDIIERAAHVFDLLYVGVAINIRKKPVFAPAERIDYLQKITQHYSNIRVVTYEGLTINYARSINANILVRGLRTAADLQLEFQMATTNKTLALEIETIFFPTAPEFAFVNSSLVREIAAAGGNITSFIPQPIAEDVKKKLAERLGSSV